MHTFKPSSWEAEVGGLGVQGQLGLHREEEREGRKETSKKTCYSLFPYYECKVDFMKADRADKM